MSKFVDVIVGARPNFIKVAAIIKEMQRRLNGGRGPGYRLIHTSQHYDPQMSGVFFEDLDMPAPDLDLRVCDTDSTRQVAAMISRYSDIVAQTPPDMVMVSGDVNSTVACALAVKKTAPSIPLVHVEAGLRSRDRSMPEEINRVITDSISDYFFTTSRSATANLVSEHVDPSRIFFVGNTMIDTLNANIGRFRRPPVWDELGLSQQQYIVLTLHRKANISDADTLRSLLEAVAEASAAMPVIFPVHPHTARIMEQFGIAAPGICCIQPMGYLEFNYLVQHSRAVVTDSGGISEETTMMQVPCMTLRSNTERPETCTTGTNLLLGNDHQQIFAAFHRLFSGNWPKGGQPELWDGRSAERIVNHIAEIVYAENGLLSFPRPKQLTDNDLFHMDQAGTVPEND